MEVRKNGKNRVWKSSQMLRALGWFRGETEPRESTLTKRLTESTPTKHHTSCDYFSLLPLEILEIIVDYLVGDAEGKISYKVSVDRSNKSMPTLTLDKCLRGTYYRASSSNPDIKHYYPIKSCPRLLLVSQSMYEALLPSYHKIRFDSIETTAQYLHDLSALKSIPGFLAKNIVEAHLHLSHKTDGFDYVPFFQRHINDVYPKLKKLILVTELPFNSPEIEPCDSILGQNFARWWKRHVLWTGSGTKQFHVYVEVRRTCSRLEPLPGMPLRVLRKHVCPDLIVKDVSHDEIAKHICRGRVMKHVCRDEIVKHFERGKIRVKFRMHSWKLVSATQTVWLKAEQSDRLEQQYSLSSDYVRAILSRHCWPFHITNKIPMKATTPPKMA